MSLFSADWLDRREPHDRRARNPAVLAAVTKAFANDASVSAVDLACGTGATVRALGEALPRHQHWRLIDNDLGLLARAKAAAPQGARANIMAIDLARDLEAALDGPVDLVTTSAFLDLVSEDWLERLVTEIAARRLPFYAALSYDGRVVMTPVDDADATIVSAFNRHQTSDKGFGPALGPASAAHAVTMFERLGYQVVQGKADWRIEASDPLQMEIVSSMAAAARELVGVPQATIEGWATRRRILAAAGRSTLQIGHIDFFARPTERR
ncbi:MAG: class I SAM-dependent methyltransferase [Rhodoplanes sp.]|uniref:class I SAM-dependent methyltransferase n=1 Tax=Rhodoplanes sp. TaxID=1968906 RepID=UPI001849D575|nr:class I SAM-dependent methyltransferase [Rhodoplanes sp.]NVO14166.1 class I SAM-dependent methyltransferase [Rhodoplanes sp.]